MSKLKIDQLEGYSATTVTLPAGQTLDLSNGTVTLPDSAIDLSSAKVTNTLPTSKGGTGLTALGSAGTQLGVNSGASGLELATFVSGKVGAVSFGKKTDTFTTTTINTDHDIGLSAAITPTAAGSSIMIIVSVCSGSPANSSAGNHFFLARDVASAGYSEITAFTGDASGSRERGIFSGSSEQGSDWTQESSQATVLDSSSTGLSYSLGQTITYKVRGRTPNSQAINRSWRDDSSNDDTRTISTIMLLEILA